MQGTPVHLIYLWIPLHVFVYFPFKIQLWTCYLSLRCLLFFFFFFSLYILLTGPLLVIPFAIFPPSPPHFSCEQVGDLWVSPNPGTSKFCESRLICSHRGQTRNSISQLKVHIPHTGKSFGDRPYSRCSGPIWRPSCTSATYVLGGLGPSPICSFTSDSNSERTKEPG